MQDCVPENKLIRLLADELTTTEREQILSHVHVCSNCRRTWEELHTTWNLLEQVDVAPPERDLTASVLAKAATLRVSGTRWIQAVRVAAVIILASGLGVAAGLLAPRRTSYAYVTSAVSDEQVVEALGLDAMDLDTDLFAGVFEAQDSPDNADQEQPS